MTTEKLKLSFQWDIEDYIDCDLIYDESFESPRFYTTDPIFKSDWKLRLHPHSLNIDHPSLQLIRYDAGPKLNITFKISVLNKYGTPIDTVNCPDLFGSSEVFRLANHAEVHRLFIENYTKKFLHDHKLSILCEIEMCPGGPGSTNTSPIETPWDLSELERFECKVSAENHMQMYGLTQIIAKKNSPVQVPWIADVYIPCGEIILRFEANKYKMRLIDEDHPEIQKVYVSVAINSHFDICCQISRDWVDIGRYCKTEVAMISSRCMIATISDAYSRKVPKIIPDFKNAFFNPKFGDTSIEVDGKTLRVHEEILCERSQVFAAMFSQEWLEKSTQIVKIKEFDFQTILTVMEYLYTNVDEWQGAVDPVKLLEAAAMYELEHLKNKCEQRLCCTLTKDNVFNRLQLSDMYGLTLLKSAVLVYSNDRRHLTIN